MNEELNSRARDMIWAFEPWSSGLNAPAPQRALAALKNDDMPELREAVLDLIAYGEGHASRGTTTAYRMDAGKAARAAKDFQAWMNRRS